MLYCNCNSDHSIIVLECFNNLKMIEKHLTLSCYTLEHPFTTNYSNFDEELLDIIDSSNDIYEFKLAEAELYEVKVSILRK